MQLPIKPQLAQSVPAPSDGRWPAPFGRDDWSFEVKHDGYRAVMHLRPGRKPMIWSRPGRVITDDFTDLFEHLTVMREVVLDGEIVFRAPDGKLSFDALIARRMYPRDVQAAGLAFYPFDVLSVAGQDVWSKPLRERNRLLHDELALVQNEHFLPLTGTTDGIAAWKVVEAERLEGLIAKPLSAPYRFGERGTWKKIKRTQVATFRVVGYVPGIGARAGGIGVLVLARHFSERGWEYAGAVGTGFDGPKTAQLLRELQPTIKPVLEGNELTKAQHDLSKLKTHADGSQSRGIDTVVWTEPTLDAVVEFSEYMAGGAMRFPSYKGLAA